MIKISDEWETPQDLFDKLDKEFNFKVDACANEGNAKCDLYLKDASKRWDSIPNVNSSMFCNPPYSRGKTGPILKRAWEASEYTTVVCLVLTRVLSCKYFDFLDHHNGENHTRYWVTGLEVRHLSRRVKFTNPHRESSSPNFECCLLIMNKSEQ